VPAEEKINLAQESKLSVFQQQAREYRNQGTEAQRIADNDKALRLFQKAVELDPAYAVAYNDLGIIFELKGQLDKAEASYLKAVKIDPLYLSPCTNLALLYENKRELDRALYYWKKRAELGGADDPWAEKARERIADINLVLSNTPLEDAREQEAIGFMNDISLQKTLMKKDNRQLAREELEKAKSFFKAGDEVSALKLAIDASQLDPANSEINDFLERVETRLLSR
jgi:tetratricopeptide (TPR) repeat protein